MGLAATSKSSGSGKARGLLAGGSRLCAPQVWRRLVTWSDVLHLCVLCVFASVQNGYWKRWQLLKGGNAEGTLEWEETWWEASDWTGLKEMGARKEGERDML